MVVQVDSSNITAAAASCKGILILSRYPSSGDGRDGLFLKPPIGSFSPKKNPNAKSWIRLSRPSPTTRMQVDSDKFQKSRTKPSHHGTKEQAEQEIPIYYTRAYRRIHVSHSLCFSSKSLFGIFLFHRSKTLKTCILEWYFVVFLWNELWNKLGTS